MWRSKGLRLVGDCVQEGSAYLKSDFCCCCFNFTIKTFAKVFKLFDIKHDFLSCYIL